MSAPAFAVEIDGVFQIVRRQELRQPHGAGPGAFHVGELDVALLQHLERQQKFVAELVLALAVIGLRRQHADGVVGVAGAAVVGLAAEDRQHHGRRDAELPLDRGERRPVLIVELAALRGQAIEGRLFQIIRRRLDEFRLARLLSFRPPGNDQLRQRQIGLEPARRHVERRARHAERLRLRPQRLQPRLERRIGGEGGDTSTPARGKLRWRRTRGWRGTSPAMTTKNLHRTATMNSRGNRSSTLPSKRGR